MRRTYVWGVTVLLLVAVAACGGSSEPSSVDRLGDAFCADLANGLSIFQIYAPANDRYTPESFAAHAAIWAEESCPGQLRTNDGLRGYLDAYSIPFDG